jgi:hypothetical protein
MDAVDYKVASSMPLKEFTINFNHETRHGDKVGIYRISQESEDGINVFIEGKVDGQSAFCVKMIF